MISLRQPGCHDPVEQDFRPLALRPRFSTGLPLSDEQCKVPTKRAWFFARLVKIILLFHLRQPGCHNHILRDFRPLALRPRFSTGLLFSI